jgi:hypothetical protein
LEEFGATGLRRTQIQRKSGREMVSFDVDSRTTLPDGKEIDGLNDLKQYLLTKKRNQFARAVVRRLMTYALGRSLELSDHEAVDHLTDDFLQSGCNLRELIQMIATSDVFGSK